MKKIFSIVPLAGIFLAGHCNAGYPFYFGAPDPLMTLDSFSYGSFYPDSGLNKFSLLGKGIPLKGLSSDLVTFLPTDGVKDDGSIAKFIKSYDTSKELSFNGKGFKVIPKPNRGLPIIPLKGPEVEDILKGMEVTKGLRLDGPLIKEFQAEKASGELGALLGHHRLPLKVPIVKGIDVGILKPVSHIPHGFPFKESIGFGAPIFSLHGHIEAPVAHAIPIHREVIPLPHKPIEFSAEIPDLKAPTIIRNAGLVEIPAPQLHLSEHKFAPLVKKPDLFHAKHILPQAVKIINPAPLLLQKEILPVRQHAILPLHALQHDVHHDAKRIIVPEHLPHIHKYEENGVARREHVSGYLSGPARFHFPQDIGIHGARGEAVYAQQYYDDQQQASHGGDSQGYHSQRDNVDHFSRPTHNLAVSKDANNDYGKAQIDPGHGHTPLLQVPVHPVAHLHEHHQPIHDEPLHHVPLQHAQPVHATVHPVAQIHHQDHGHHQEHVHLPEHGHLPEGGHHQEHGHHHVPVVVQHEHHPVPVHHEAIQPAPIHAAPIHHQTLIRHEPVHALPVAAAVAVAPVHAAPVHNEPVHAAAVPIHHHHVQHHHHQQQQDQHHHHLQHHHHQQQQDQHHHHHVQQHHQQHQHQHHHVQAHPIAVPVHHEATAHAVPVHDIQPAPVHHTRHVEHRIVHTEPVHAHHSVVGHAAPVAPVAHEPVHAAAPVAAPAHGAIVHQQYFTIHHTQPEKKVIHAPLVAHEPVPVVKHDAVVHHEHVAPVHAEPAVHAGPVVPVISHVPPHPVPLDEKETPAASESVEPEIPVYGSKKRRFLRKKKSSKAASASSSSASASEPEPTVVDAVDDNESGKKEN